MTDRLAPTDYVQTVTFRDPTPTDGAWPIHVTSHVELDGVAIPVADSHLDFNRGEPTVVTLYIEPQHVAPPVRHTDASFAPGGIADMPVLAVKMDDTSDCAWAYDEHTGLVECRFYAARVVFE